MIKNLRKSSITYTPFTAFKEWKFDSINSASAIPFVPREGLEIGGIFYPTESIYHNQLTEPTNSDGTYKRVIYNTIDLAFYRNDSDPLKCFGVENFVHENSDINGRIAAIQLDRKYWGEKIVPNSVTITDYSNPDEIFVIKDDGNTNLYLQNKTFASYDLINPKEFPYKIIYTSDDPYIYYNVVNGLKSYMSRESAIELWKNGQGPVFTDESKIKTELVYLTHSYSPQNERFGASVSTYNDCILIGSPADNDTFSEHKSGRAFLYKINPSTGRHDVIRNLYFDGSQASIINDNSNHHIISTELGDFVLYENGNLCSTGSTFVVQDNFGASVAMTDNFAVIGASTVDICQSVCPISNGTSSATNIHGATFIATVTGPVENVYTITWTWSPTGPQVYGGVDIYDAKNGNFTGEFDGTISLTPTSGSMLVTVETGSKWMWTGVQNSTGGSDDYTFGNWIKLSGPESLETNAAGLVFCYQGDKGGPNNWGLINVLQGENETDEFGFSTSIKGDTLVVGAPGYDNNNGAIYIFKLKRYMSDGCDSVPTSSLGSGSIVTIQDSDFIVTSGSNQQLTALFYTGLWQPTSTECLTSSLLSSTDMVPGFVVGDYTWRLLQKITGSNQSRFGGDVSISNGVLVVGNKSLDVSPKLAWVYASEYTGSICPTESWTLKTVLSSSGIITDHLPGGVDGNNESNNYFGYSVATNGKYIAIGAPKDTFVDYDVGAVYFYEYEIPVECSQTAGVDKEIRFIDRLYANTIQLETNDFGSSVSMNHNKLIVGAPIDFQSQVEVQLTGSNKFSVEEINDYFGRSDIRSVDGNFYIYDLTKSYELEKRVNWTKRFGFPHRRFGYDVSIGNNLICVGAPLYSYTDSTSSLFKSESYMDTPSNWEDSASYEMRGSAFSYNISDLNDNSAIGNVFYKNGTIVLTHTGSQFSNVFFTTGSEQGYTIEYKGQQTINEQEIIVSVNPGEFNVSTNPTGLINNIPFDVNGDGLFDVNDMAVLLKYINGEPIVDLSKLGDAIGSEQNYKWWNNGPILTESEDLLLASSLFDNISTLGFLTPERYEYIVTNLVNTGLLNIDGNYDVLNPLPKGKIDPKDALIIFYYFNNQLTPEILSELIDDTSSRRYVKEIISYLDRMTGNSSGGLLTKTQATILKNRSGSVETPMFGTNNGSSIDPNFMNFSESSSLNRTGSYLAPYITTVGLYNGGDLVAVAKLGKPVKNLIDYPLNIAVRFDFG